MTPAILTPLLAPTVQQMSRVIGLVLLSFLERPLSAPHPPFQNQTTGRSLLEAYFNERGRGLVSVWK